MTTTAALGLLVGVVIDVRDPERLGRVRVEYPELGKDVRSDWARLVTPMAGAKRGMVFRPEPGDEVLVGFLHGDPRAAYVLGGVWNVRDRPPADDGKPANNWRFITSRSGHVVKLDDTAGRERIEVIDKSRGCRVVLDSARRQIVVEAGKGGILLSAKGGTITLSGQDIELSASATVRVRAGRGVDISSNTSVKAEARTTFSVNGGRHVSIRGNTVDIN